MGNLNELQFNSNVDLEGMIPKYNLSNETTRHTTEAYIYLEI